MAFIELNGSSCGVCAWLQGQDCLRRWVVRSSLCARLKPRSMLVVLLRTGDGL